MQPDFFERHGKKIEKSGDCWIWTGFRDKDGYGLVTTFSISQAAAYQIITRRTWRHVA